MSANTPRLLFTTQNRDIPTANRGRAAGSHDNAFALVPELVLGSTISTANALSAAVDTDSFAFCAGSTVILAKINSKLGINQRLFCASPDALPAQATPTYYNSATPTKATVHRGYNNALPKDESTPGTGSLAPSDHNADSPSKAKSAHRSRSLTCLALSPSGKFLAVGEVGYRPRILIFSTASDVPTNVPLACLTEHTFGARALAFSPDSRWLCSLGDIHDGALFLWSINPRTGALRLDSSNRCTTADTIAWTGASVVTVGTRHVKIWRLEQPSSPSKSRRVLDNAHDGSTASPVPKTFAGRNCVLGPLKDATFTCVVGISEDRAVLGTQDGAICILDDANRTQNLYQVSKEDHCITCITVDRSSGVVWLGGEGVEPKALSLDVLLTVDGPSASPQARDGLGKQVKEKKGGTPYTLAICCVGNRLVAMDSSRVMRIYDIEPTTTDSPRISSIQQLAAHDKPVLGAVILSKPNANESDFLTFSENGDVLHWLWDGTCKSRCLVSLDHSLACAIEEANGLRVVLASSQSAMLFAGDKAGLLQYSLTSYGFLDANGEAKVVAKAHDGEVFDLALHESDGDDSLVASCGRDRTIQIFRIYKEECSLQQSLVNEHAGPIRKLVFADNGSILASMSPDRTVAIHKRVARPDESVAFVSTKVVSLKATPLAMSLLPGAMPTLLVSATDRCLRKISIAEGHITQTIKMADPPNGESGSMSRLSVGDLDQNPNGPGVIAGFSSADRSIRLYDVETGSLLAMGYGQAAVSDLAVATAPDSHGEKVNKVISTGFDGTVMIWGIPTLSNKDGLSHDAAEGTHATDPSRIPPPLMLRPLRRVLSKAELSQHQKSLERPDSNTPDSATNSSSSRPGRKASRYAVSETSEDQDISARIRSSHVSAGGSIHKSRIKPASPPWSPKTRLQTRARRSSLDERHRDTAARCNNPRIATTAKQLLDSLQEFRKQLVASKESLSPETTQALWRELHSTMDTLTERATRRSEPHAGDDGGTGNNGSFDDFLAKLIDDRLALRFPSGDQGAGSTEGGARDTTEHVQARSGTNST